VGYPYDAEKGDNPEIEKTKKITDPFEKPGK
jgi:hypothetical protein